MPYKNRRRREKRSREIRAEAAETAQGVLVALLKKEGGRLDSAVSDVFALEAAALLPHNRPDMIEAYLRERVGGRGNTAEAREEILLEVLRAHPPRPRFRRLFEEADRMLAEGPRLAAAMRRRLSR